MRKPETVAFWRGRLPHWEVVDGRYFVTIHLAGAIPEQGVRKIQEIARQLAQTSSTDSPEWIERQRLIFREMEAWLDRATAATHLRQTPIAELIVEAIEHRVRNNVWQMFEYVVMPNHLHLFFELLRLGLKETLSEFKRWTGHQAARLLNASGKRFWQREWFDHWSRSDDEDDRIARYIRKNPEQAGLVTRYHDWPYGSWREGPFRQAGLT